MYNLSLSQQFLMFAVNKQGKISSLDTRTWVCCVTSAVIDLHLNDCVSISDEKRPTVSTTAELPSTLHHLLPIYQRISEKGPIKLNKLVEQYMMGRSGPALSSLTLWETVWLPPVPPRHRSVGF